MVTPRAEARAGAALARAGTALARASLASSGRMAEANSVLAHSGAFPQHFEGPKRSVRRPAYTGRKRFEAVTR